MAVRHYIMTLRVSPPQLEAGNWMEVESSYTSGLNLEDIRKAFNPKYGVMLMNANMGCFEIR